MGDLIATGSNDKTIRMLRFDNDNYTSIGEGIVDYYMSTCSFV